jgi:mono/diheme cytochrome c family protein
LLSPYPRDFRLGKYKFKSTAQGNKPTKEDLAKTIRNGIPGTSMPSFALLPDEDIDALTDYVVYLSVRGETERELLRQLASTLDYSRGDRIIDAKWRESDPASYESKLGELTKLATSYLTKWRVDTPQAPIRPSELPIWDGPNTSDSAKDSKLVESVARGKELFVGNIANCSKCHGDDGTGRTAPRDYDQWTKDWSLGINPEDKAAIKPFLKAGAFKPIQLYPRNLRLGVFRGGNEPEDLYTRIIHGIEGTSMPAAALQTQTSQGLTSDQIWDLVNYVLSLDDRSSSREEGSAL